MSTAYDESGFSAYPTWIVASLVVLSAHLAVAAYLMVQPRPESRGANADAVLVDLIPPNRPPSPSGRVAPAVPPPDPAASPSPEPTPVESKQDVDPVRPSNAMPAAVPPPSRSLQTLPSVPASPAPIPLAPMTPSPAVEATPRMEVMERPHDARVKAAVQTRRIAEDRRHRLDEKRQAARHEDARAATDTRVRHEPASRQAQASSPAAMGAWQGQVRARIFANVTRGEPGSANVVFVVTGGGGIVRASVSDASPTAMAALAAVRHTGSVPAPPDHQAHSLSIRINVN